MGCVKLGVSMINYILIYISCTFKRIEIIGVYSTRRRAEQMRVMAFTEYPDGYWFIEECLDRSE